jgi:hypothetical protein
MLNHAHKLTFSVFTGITTITAIIFLQLQTLNLNKEIYSLNQPSYFKQEKQEKIKVDLQKTIPNFGFNNLIADWAFLQFIQYFGDSEAREVTGYSLVTDYFENIVNRDPNFIESYFVISPANSIFAAKPEKTVEIIDKGLKTITPQSPSYPFYLWTYKATDEILFLGDLKAAQKSYETAAAWAKLRNDNLGQKVAKSFEKTAAFLATNPDPTQAQISAWMNILSTARDEQTAKYVIQELKELGVEVSISNDGKLNIKQIK